MAEYFDAYRIDHVLGFFRIWEIPANAVHGLLGQFSPSLGMTPREVEAYGLRWQEDLFTTPFIADWTLDRIFGERAAYVKDTFLDRKHDDIWQMKPQYDTQRKVEAWYKAQSGRGEELDSMRDGLYALISDVLFVPDRKEQGKFHPRIGVQNDFIYQTLYDGDKEAFNRLYNEYFYRRNNFFWYTEAMEKMPRLTQATRMLVCAEDLGMVPDCVPGVMRELGILSLEIQRMPKAPGNTFFHPKDAPYLSVVTPSTHDMSTIRGWWEEDRALTQRFWNEQLGGQGDAPWFCEPAVCRDILAQHFYSPAMWSIFQLQDLLSMDGVLRRENPDDERINVPANPKHYWRYRMHFTLENLQQAADFNAALRGLVQGSGRG